MDGFGVPAGDDWNGELVRLGVPRVDARDFRRPWAEDGDGDEEDNELEDVREILGAGNELLGGGKTSFLSEDPEGVVVSSSLPLTLLDTAVD